MFFKPCGNWCHTQGPYFWGQSLPRRRSSLAFCDLAILATSLLDFILSGTLCLCQKSNQIVPRQELGKWQEGWGCGKWSRKLKQRWPCGLAKAGPALHTWDPWLHKQIEPPRIKSPRIHWVSTILVTWPSLILEKTCYAFQCEWYSCQTALLEPSP